MENTPHSQSSNENCTAPRSCSPFRALAVLFITVGFQQGAYLINDFGTCDRIQLARSELKTVLAQARTINQTTEAVGRDLIVLASKSPEAARIVAEFKLEISNPAPAAE